MAVFLWALLNWALAAFIFVIFVKAVIRFRERFGTVTAIVVALLLLSFTKKKDHMIVEKPVQICNPIFANEQEQLHAHKKRHRIVLEKNFLYEIVFNVIEGYAESMHKNVPISGWTTINGIISYVEWKPAIININNNLTGNKLTYTVEGSEVWNLMGINVYSQNKIFSGVVPVQ